MRDNKIEEKVELVELTENVISLAQHLKRATEVLEQQNKAIHFLSNNLEALLVSLINKDVITVEEVAKQYDQIIKQFNQGGSTEDFPEGEKPVDSPVTVSDNTSTPKGV